jgi:hypothetical protein
VRGGARICSWRGPCNDTAEAAVFTDLERKLWESILGSRYFRPARGGGEGKGIRFRGIRRELRGARGVKNGVKGSQKRHPLSRK